MDISSVERVTVTCEDAVAIITLNRPEKRNAINPEMARLIERAIDHLESNDRLRVGIIRAEMQDGHAVFCSGHDLQHFRDTLGTEEEMAVCTDRGGFAGVTERARTKPLIAAVDGLATAGGFEMVLACDMVIASTRASFGVAEVKWNLVSSGGGAFRLPRAVGRYVAADILLTADQITAERAYELGLVSRLVRPGEVDAAALAAAGRIACNGPRAIVLTRALVQDAQTVDEPTAWEMLREAERDVRGTEDLLEGLAAFNENRSPRWSGR